VSNGTDTKRIAQAGSLQTPSILRRNPKLAREIRARRLSGAAPTRNLAPARNRWSGALWAANTIIRTIFAAIGAIAVLVAALVFFGRF
jgi:hypothetical protein